MTPAAGPLNLGLIGRGAIGRLVAQYCAERPAQFRIVGILTRSGVRELGCEARDVRTPHELIALAPDLVLECAGHQAVADAGACVLGAGVDLVLASVGALADEALLESLREASARGGGRMRIPSGALAGVDALAAARQGGLERVSLRSCKPSGAWMGATALAAGTEAPQVIFRGSARQAARAFPRNANIAATVALAGIGFDATEVELVADPTADRNRHRLEARGAFGEFVVDVVAASIPGAPQSSALAAMSLMRALANASSGLVI